MITRSLEDASYEDIKSYVLHPQESSLDPQLREEFDRIVSISKIIEKNPVQKNAIALHQALYPEISLSTAYRDLRLATRVFHSIRTFDYNLWHQWLLNSIAESIQKLRSINDAASLKILSAEHANLIKAIGAKPEETADPLRNEKHQFYILINQDNNQAHFDINRLKDLPESTLAQINKIIWGGQEITDITAQEIMNT